METIYTLPNGVRVVFTPVPSDIIKIEEAAKLKPPTTIPSRPGIGRKEFKFILDKAFWWHSD